MLPVRMIWGSSLLLSSPHSNNMLCVLMLGLLRGKVRFFFFFCHNALSFPIMRCSYCVGEVLVLKSPRERELFLFLLRIKDKSRHLKTREQLGLGNDFGSAEQRALCFRAADRNLNDSNRDNHAIFRGKWIDCGWWIHDTFRFGYVALWQAWEVDCLCIYMA